MLRAFGMCAIALASCALAGTAPKTKPGDYPVQARVGDVEIAAAYLVHTLPAEGANFLVPDYLVVEIAIYPPKSEAVAVAAGQFRLRMNGKKEASADTPEMVAMSLKYPDWEGRHGPEPQVALGPVILGRTQPGERFPGDPGPNIGQGPKPPTVPMDQPRDANRPPPQTAAEAAVALAFPDCPCLRPVSGYLYFRYDGKVKSIRSLDLIWQRGEQQATIRLF
jgi:hypothetical protein